MKDLKKVGLMIAACCMLWFSMTVTVSADVTSGLLLTDILYSSDIHAESESEIKVNVQEIIVDSEGKITKQEPFTEAVVLLTVTKGSEQKTLEMSHRADGTYVAKYAFPTEGEWLVHAKAEYRQGHDPGHDNGAGHHHDSQQDELDAKVVVKAKESPSILTWVLAGGIGLGALVLVLLRRGQKS